MAYTPKTWECGDTITADELNRMERGIADAGSGGGTASEPLIVTATQREATAEECFNGGTAYEFDYSWQEIFDALARGIPAFFLQTDTSAFAAMSPICYAGKQEFIGEPVPLSIGILGNGGDDSFSIYKEFVFEDATSKTAVICDNPK